MNDALLSAAEQQLLQQLTQLANGMDPQDGHRKVALAERLEAGNRLRFFREKMELEQRRRTEVDRQHKIQAAQQTLQEGQQRHQEDLDQSRLMLEAELERRKLDQVDQRIEIEKAEVIVRALEAAARNPELIALTQVVSEMSHRLLGGEVLPALALEDKSTKET